MVFLVQSYLMLNLSLHRSSGIKCPPSVFFPVGHFALLNLCLTKASLGIGFLPQTEDSNMFLESVYQRIRCGFKKLRYIINILE